MKTSYHYVVARDCNDFKTDVEVHTLHWYTWALILIQVTATYLDK